MAFCVIGEFTCRVCGTRQQRLNVTKECYKCRCPVDGPVPPLFMTTEDRKKDAKEGGQ
jgi:hypothetical protein